MSEFRTPPDFLDTSLQSPELTKTGLNGGGGSVSTPPHRASVHRPFCLFVGPLHSITLPTNQPPKPRRPGGSFPRRADAPSPSKGSATPPLVAFPLAEQQRAPKAARPGGPGSTYEGKDGVRGLGARVPHSPLSAMVGQTGPTPWGGGVSRTSPKKKCLFG